jgi:hypothetical protein
MISYAYSNKIDAPPEHIRSAPKPKFKYGIQQWVPLLKRWDFLSGTFCAKSVVA